MVERPGIEDVQLLRVQSTSLADLHLSACAHFSIESCEEPLLAEAQPSTSGSEGTIVRNSFPLPIKSLAGSSTTF